MNLAMNGSENPQQDVASPARRLLIDQVRYRIKYFSPAWYAMVMGTGISSTILIEFPFPSRWLRAVGVAFWAAACAELAIFAMLTTSRHILFPSTFSRMQRHPIQCLFWGCIPMALSAVLNSTMAVFGHRAVWPCYVLWWVDTVLSFACAWVLVFVGFATLTRTQPVHLNAVVLLPVVTLVVNASTGATITAYLPDHWRGHMILICMIIWGNGECLAAGFIAIYLGRLLAFKLPERDSIISSFLPIGPLCQGAYGLLLTAANAELHLHVPAIVPSGSGALVRHGLLMYVAVAVALIMLGFATFWLVCAVSACFVRRPRRFAITWWGMTFPVGTFAMASRELGFVLDLQAFKVISCITGVFVVMATLTLTVASAYHSLFTDLVFVVTQEEMDDQFKNEIND
ncbi:voltage-dependent anion channel [Lipomyces japonicus]|uniref:voltage-dependent anion channel n=1 Tax=Lipomyces japonicus TaxID=56871 RepID=UPI0034CEDC0D